MLAREAPVSAVSLAEKKAEIKRQPTTITNVNQSMADHHFACWSDPLRRIALFALV
jgi:hypothetical protein